MMRARTHTVSHTNALRTTMLHDITCRFKGSAHLKMRNPLKQTQPFYSFCPLRNCDSEAFPVPGRLTFLFCQHHEHHWCFPTNHLSPFTSWTSNFYRPYHGRSGFPFFTFHINPVLTSPPLVSIWASLLRCVSVLVFTSRWSAVRLRHIVFIARGRSTVPRLTTCNHRPTLISFTTRNKLHPPSWYQETWTQPERQDPVDATHSGSSLFCLINNHNRVKYHRVCDCYCETQDSHHPENTDV